MIPAGILEAVPSAELSEDQVDPFDYQVVGPVVSDFIEKGLGPRDLLRSFKEQQLDETHYALEGKDIYQRYSAPEFEVLVVELFNQLNRSVYKRLQGAPIVAVSHRAFGFDLRETIINGWSGD